MPKVCPEPDSDPGVCHLYPVPQQDRKIAPLNKTIEAKGMKQSEAAKLLGVTQPRVSDLYKGKIHLFSIDTPVDMLSRAGIHIKLVVGSSKRKLKVA